MKKILTLSLTTLILTITLSCGNIKNYTDRQYPRYIGYYHNEQKVNSNKLKVVSFNIKYAIKTDIALKEFSKNKDLKNADIILLQEMDEDGVLLLAKELGLNYIYFPACNHRNNKDFGNAILSKLPIMDNFKIILPHKNPINKQQRIASGADLLFDNKIIRVYSVHTEVAILNIEDRLEQVESIVNSIPDNIKYVIVGGDFNTILKSTEGKIEKIFRDKELIQATKSIPYTIKIGPGGVLRFKTDNIYVRGLTINKSGFYEQSQASDHLPIWSYFSIN